MLYFSQGQLNETIVLQLLEDATPEDKDEYRVLLSNIKTFGKKHFPLIDHYKRVHLKEM